MKKVSVIILACFVALPVFAGGWTNGGRITEIEIVRAQGFMVKGNFGDANDCGISDYLWVPIDNTQYDITYSTILAAYMAGKKIKAYAHECREIGWHGGSYSTMTSSGAMYLRD
ncbi:MULTISPECIES: hypothetical protein [unclassified Oleiphilus]|uniref:hypothetical protein n=1 Tax=unclassified Oleiphilus TaxID=2631174 RepID=UPI0007C29863|nr:MULTISPECIES: hypothetical protein [unclassified Oleiphilus]KZY41286.1 hypothetical protein A3732_18415 [Oleiphilus sp. HI0050]KZZ34320.1 hypothetical protein A3757_17985 [Oleiphilus sp. HI0117]KZZ53292.1 hypothetical protein A3761_17535 [Oleiphilus sp. HI0123]